MGCMCNRSKAPPQQRLKVFKEPGMYNHYASRNNNLVFQEINLLKAQNVILQTELIARSSRSKSNYSTSPSKTYQNLTERCVLSSPTKDTKNEENLMPENEKLSQEQDENKSSLAFIKKTNKLGNSSLNLIFKQNHLKIKKKGLNKQINLFNARKSNSEEEKKLNY